MKARTSLATVLLSLYAQQKPHNGYWWASFSSEFKLGFVSGYIESIANESDLAVYDRVVPKNSDRPQNVPRQEVLSECEQYSNPRHPDFTNIPFGQFVDGVNAFYQDYRNKNIVIKLALIYVRDVLKGTPAKELEDELTSWRHIASQ